MLWWFRPRAEEVGWSYVQLLTWCKPNFSGGAGRISADWNIMTENILLFRKGKRTPMQNGQTTTHNYFVVAAPQTNFTADRKEHVAQFPIELPRRLISRTPGQVVFDPFMGSGSVGVAAVKLKRDFVGMEVSKIDFGIAKRRIEEAQMQMVMPL